MRRGDVFDLRRFSSILLSSWIFPRDNARIFKATWPLLDLGSNSGHRRQGSRIQRTLAVIWNPYTSLAHSSPCVAIQQAAPGRTGRQSPGEHFCSLGPPAARTLRCIGTTCKQVSLHACPHSAHGVHNVRAVCGSCAPLPSSISEPPCPAQPATHGSRSLRGRH